MNLVVYYLQCIGFLPNLQSSSLMKAAGIVPEPATNYWHFINNLDTCALTWEAVRGGKLWVMPPEFDKLPLTLLLYGFFEFYSSRFPYGTHAVSIRRGNISLSKLATRKVNLFFFSIEDPFETYDSHCPHDLGIPANEYGSMKIRNCLRDAEDFLRKVLCSEKANEKRLWPNPPFVEPEPTRSNAKKSGFRHFERPLPITNGVRASNIYHHDKPRMLNINANQNMQKSHQGRSNKNRNAGRGRNGKAKSKKGSKWGSYEVQHVSTKEQRYKPDASNTKNETHSMVRSMNEEKDREWHS